MKDIIRHNCRTLIYDQFIEINITEDTTSVGGDEVWNEILIEYSELIKTEKAVSIFECWNKIQYIEWKIGFINTMLDILKDFYVDAAAMGLCEIGLDYVQNIEGPEYYKQLEMVESEAKTLFVVLQQYYNEYKRLVPDSVLELPKRDRMSYEKELAVLAKEGYKVDKKVNTVFEFCAALNCFLDEQKNRRRHGNK